MQQENKFTSKEAQHFLSSAISSFRFRALMFFKIPLIWFSGIRLQQFSRGYCEVYLPFSRSTQNPFKSVYFAAQCMAAELSTGLPVMAETIETGKKISMLVTGMKAHFFKKADHTIIFTCDAKDVIINAISEAQQSGGGIKFSLISTGIMKDGSKVAEFEFEWSIKVKT